MSSLKDRLLIQKSKLAHTVTKVETPGGKVFVEDFSLDNGQSRVRETDKSLGFVVDTQPDLEMSDILGDGRLFIGSQDVAADKKQLIGAKITHILNVASGKTISFPSLLFLLFLTEHLHFSGISNFFPDLFLYKSVEILDVPESKITAHFQPCFDFIDEALGSPTGRILVHCNAGISRSGAIVVAYVMKNRGLGLADALNFAKKSRAKVNPNPGFLSQLRDFEKDLI